MIRSIVFFLLCLPLSFTYSQSETSKYDEAIQLIEVWLEAQKDYENLPGISASVVEGQDVVWSGAFGMANREDNVETDASTMCSICSISKLFTAVAIMQLYDQGKLRLDDKVGDLLPWFDLDQAFSDSGPITVRSLLTHSSGLPREANFPYWTGPDFPFPSSKEMISELKNQETLYPASTYFQYSNLGLSLLGEIVTEVSGESYDAFVKKNILDPLGLTSTRTQMPKSMYGKELAVGYSASNRSGEREKVNLFNANGIGPAAGFASNVIDLGKFASWQFRLRDTSVAEILKPSTLKNMHNVHWTNPDFNTTWGLGFVVYKGPGGSKWVSHGGSCPGYRSVLQLDLNKKRAFAVMINASGTNPGKYSAGINGILGKIKGEKADDNEADQLDLTAYTGYYNSQPWWGESYISTWEGKLVEISLPTDNPANSMTLYKHIEGDTFRRIRKNDDLGETVVFERDENGQVYRMKQHGNYSKKMRKEAPKSE